FSRSLASSDDGGSVTGYYSDKHDVYHGFVRTADGTVTKFDPKKVDVDRGQRHQRQRRHRGIFRRLRRRNAVAGLYGSFGAPHGFTRNADGTFGTFDPV